MPEPLAAQTTAMPTSAPTPTAGHTHSFTQLLVRWRDGDAAAFDSAIEICLHELRRIASARLRHEGDATFSVHDLLNEAVIRLMEGERNFANRNHFLATVSLHMRAILVDHARSRQAAKRGGGSVHVTLTSTSASHQLAEGSMAFELVALDEALSALELHDSQTSLVLHHTYFTGLDRQDVAAQLGISVATVDRSLRFGRVWLSERLERDIG